MGVSTFDPGKHPRNPAGSPAGAGGKFAEKQNANPDGSVTLSDGAEERTVVVDVPIRDVQPGDVIVAPASRKPSRVTSTRTRGEAVAVNFADGSGAVLRRGASVTKLNHRVTEPPDGLHEPFANWYRAAVESGWEEYPPGGPWGLQDKDGGTDPRTKQLYQTGERHPGDRSVVLRHGDKVVWLVDRDVRPAGRGDVPPRRELVTHAWFADGLAAAAAPVPDVFDHDAVESLRGVCPKCGKDVGADGLERVGFAGRYCAACAAAERPRQEFRGWAD